MTELPLHWVDAFGEGPFTGNPAAVCLLDAEADPGWMQALAAEIGLSETAFVRPLDYGFSLRWFTPTSEIDLCGHATLATAHTLREAGKTPDGQTIEFHTRSGILRATPRGTRIELEFPITPLTVIEPPAALESALAPLRIVASGRSSLVVVAELESESAVRAANPNLEDLRALPDTAVLVTALSDEDGVDYVLRCFGPNVGIDEDPVTGSAQCALGPYWADRFGRPSLVAVQASARGGRLWVEVGETSVGIRGEATTVFRGTVVVP